MRHWRGFFAVLFLAGAATAGRAADQDFNGRWDILVNKPPAEIVSTTTKAWWLGITGAGTSDLKVQFVGSPDGSLDDIQVAKIENGVLHYTWQSRVGRDGKTHHIDYEVKLVKGKLEGSMSGEGDSLTFTGFRSRRNQRT